MTRKLTKRDRKIFRRNALKGTLKWSNERHATRVRQANRKKFGWGFNGESPRTRQRHRKNLAMA